MSLRDSLQAELVGRYKVDGEIGRGAMATVYLAEDLKHDRKVAIKVFRPEFAASFGTERFLREIQVAAQLQHPHTLMLIDSGEAADTLFYVMPYIDGESLRARLTGNNGCPSMTRSKSPESWRTVSITRTREESFIATSSRRTSCSPADTPSWSISGLPAP